MAHCQAISVFARLRVVEFAGVLRHRHHLMRLLSTRVHVVTATVLILISTATCAHHTDLRLLGCVALQTLMMKVNLGLFPGSWLMRHEAWLRRVHLAHLLC